MNSRFYLTICMNFFTFISHVVSLQSKQPLFFPRGLHSPLLIEISSLKFKLRTYVEE